MSNDPYRVLVTGSGDWEDERLVYNLMHLMLALNNGAQITWVHGDAAGLDTIVKGFVEGSWNQFYSPDDGTAYWLHEPHPADWKIGKRAGYLRNTHMVALDARYCLAFINPCVDKRCGSTSTHGSHGTIDCAAKAEDRGIETWRFNRATA